MRLHVRKYVALANAEKIMCQRGWLSINVASGSAHA
jgi:hypothetical protein